MSKRSRRRNKMLAALALGIGASKLGMLGAKGPGSSNVVGKTPDFRKSFVKDKVAVIPKDKPIAKTFPRLKVTETGDVIKDGKNLGVGNVKTKFATSEGVFQGGKKVADVNPKSIFRTSEGKIKVGGKTYESKKAYSDAMKMKRSKKFTTKGSSDFGLGMYDMNKGGSVKMVKARGGGMARTKPTKMY